VVIQELCHLGSVGGLGPVAEHHRHGREHLHPHAGGVHFLDPHGGIPAVFLDIAKLLAVIPHHVGTARVVMLEGDKPAVAKTVLPLGDVTRQDVCVDVDL
jgi:hypothetical protein